MAGDSIKDGSFRVVTHGLAELRRELRQVGEVELEKRLKGELKDTAEDIAEGARKAMYPPRGNRHGKYGLSAAKRSIKASVTSSGTFIRAGAGVPSFFGFEFGGGERPGTRQFRPHLGKQGYFLYPTVRREAKGLEDRVAQAIERAFEKRT